MCACLCTCTENWQGQRQNKLGKLQCHLKTGFLDPPLVKKKKKEGERSRQLLGVVNSRLSRWDCAIYCGSCYAIRLLRATLSLPRRNKQVLEEEVVLEKIFSLDACAQEIHFSLNFPLSDIKQAVVCHPVRKKTHQNYPNLCCHLKEMKKNVVKVQYRNIVSVCLQLDLISIPFV